MLSCKIYNKIAATTKALESINTFKASLCCTICTNSNIDSLQQQNISKHHALFYSMFVFKPKFYILKCVVTA